MKSRNLSSCEKRILRPKHCALTKFLRHHDLHRAYDLEKIIEQCDVNPHVGCLPPELRRLVDKDDLSTVTAKFFDILDFITVDKYKEFSEHLQYKYDMSEISELFNTKCVLETGEPVYRFDAEHRDWARNNGTLQWQESCGNVDVYRFWGGAVGDIYKLYFPELGVSYAWKIFKTNIIPMIGHGPIYEIPTGLKAYRSEPKYNNPVYGANLLGGQYMLSKWVDINIENQIKPGKRKHAIFVTDKDENESRNYCNGKRLDYGKTYKTLYGGASYRVRKLYRQMQYMTSEQLKQLELKQKNNFEKKDFQQAQDIISFEYFNQNCGR